MTPWRSASRHCKNIEAALKQAGSGFADVVRVHYLMTNAADFERCWPAMGKAFGDVRPAATMMVVGLADPRMKIEIEVTALSASRGSENHGARAQEELAAPRKKAKRSATQEIDVTDYEKLGAFYLGREFDPAANALKDDLVLYDSKDLTTHAVCVGMTGSGKTGLCLSLLEEAAIDGVPAICIDPKGDLGNLLLTFPNLAPADFEPWVDAGDAARKGVSAARARREDRRDLEERTRRMGPGAGAHRASCAPRPTWLSTRPAPRPGCRCRCCVRSRRPVAASCWPTRAHCATASARWCRAC